VVSGVAISQTLPFFPVPLIYQSFDRDCVTSDILYPFCIYILISCPNGANFLASAAIFFIDRQEPRFLIRNTLLTIVAVIMLRKPKTMCQGRFP
jgi:hypothetical protein